MKQGIRLGICAVAGVGHKMFPYNEGGGRASSFANPLQNFNRSLVVPVVGDKGHIVDSSWFDGLLLEEVVNYESVEKGLRDFFLQMKQTLESDGAIWD